MGAAVMSIRSIHALCALLLSTALLALPAAGAQEERRTLCLVGVSDQGAVLGAFVDLRWDAARGLYVGYAEFHAPFETLRFDVFAYENEPLAGVFQFVVEADEAGRFLHMQSVPDAAEDASAYVAVMEHYGEVVFAGVD